MQDNTVVMHFNEQLKYTLIGNFKNDMVAQAFTNYKINFKRQ